MGLMGLKWMLTAFECSSEPPMIFGSRYGAEFSSVLLVMGTADCNNFYVTRFMTTSIR